MKLASRLWRKLKSCFPSKSPQNTFFERGIEFLRSGPPYTWAKAYPTLVLFDGENNPAPIEIQMLLKIMTSIENDPEFLKISNATASKLRIVFVDVDKDFIHHASNAFRAYSDVVICLCADIRDIPRNARTAFVSPSDIEGNVLDVFQNTMFPGIETYVKNKVRKVGGLHVGRACKVGNVIAASMCDSGKMVDPGHVLDNIYHAFMASLVVAKRDKAKTLVLPSFCSHLECNFDIPPERIVYRLLEAYENWLEGNIPAICK